MFNFVISNISSISILNVIFFYIKYHNIKYLSFNKSDTFGGFLYRRYPLVCGASQASPNIGLVVIFVCLVVIFVVAYRKHHLAYVNF